VSTQLRLVDTTDLADQPTSGKAASKAASGPRRAPAGSAGAPLRARVSKGGARDARSGRAGGAKRAAHWAGDLRLDDRTRTVGRAGVAAAREALERVAAEQERARSEREGRGQRAS
jgi:hypothetical protein